MSKRTRIILLGFIVLSLTLHLIFGVGTVAQQKYSEWRAEQRAATEKAELEAKREAAKKAAEEAKQAAAKKTADAVKQAAVDQLHDQFNEAVGNDLKKQATDKLWQKVLAKLTAGLDDYTKAATNPSASDQALDDEMRRLQAQMLDESAAEIKDATKRELADSFVQSVDDNVGGKMADYYRRALDQKIGTNLNREAVRIAREEAASISANRRAAMDAMDKAEKAATSAANELSAAKKRLDTAKGNPAALKQEQGTVAKVQKSLDDAAKALDDATGKASDLTAAARKAIKDANGSPVAGAKSQTDAAAKATASGDSASASKAIGDAAAAAGKLADAVRQARATAQQGNSDHNLDPNTIVRSALKEARDQDVKKNIDKAFADTVGSKAVDRVSSKLAQTFRQTLADAGVGSDEKTEAEVQKRVHDVLAKHLKDDLDAGKTSTGQMTQSQKLDDLAAGAGEDHTMSSTQPSGIASSTQPSGNTLGNKVASRLNNTAATQMTAMGNNAADADDAGDNDSNTSSDTGEKSNDSGKQGKQHKKSGANANGAANSSANAGDDEGDDDASDTNSGNTGPGGKSAGHKHHGRKGEVAGKTVEAAKQIADSNMDAIANDQGGDNGLLGAAKSGMKGHAKGKGPSDGMGGDDTASGDDAGDDGMANAALGQRLAQLARGVSSGRSDLGGGGGANAGLGQGGMPGTGGNNGGIASNPNGRRDIIAPNGRLLRGGETVYNAQEYNKLVAGLQARGGAAHGIVMERSGAGTGDASSTPDALGQPDVGAFIPRITLAPAPSTQPLVGKAEKSVPFKPEFQSIAFTTIPFRPHEMAFNSDLSDWADLPNIPVNPQGGGKDPSLRRTDQTVKACWDNTGLYFLFDVTDADDKIVKVKPSNFWEGDGAEIFIDGPNNKAKTRTGSEQQFWAWVDGQQGDPTKVGGEAVAGEDKAQYFAMDKSQLQVSSRKTDKGWAMLVHIPAERMHKLDLAPGHIFGLNFNINTGTPVYYYFAGNGNVATSTHPETWGDALLAGSEGKLECIDKLAAEFIAEGKPTETGKAVNVVKIGQPLRVRVTDADMNLSDKQKDTVEVSIQTSRGQRCKLILQETGEKTGIFEGALRTSPDIGELPEADLAKAGLRLLEGETVTVRYNDQCRPDGARNVEVKLQLPTAAAVEDLAGK